MQKTKTIEETYKKKNPIQHVLDIPDMYVGNIKADKRSMWVLENNKIVIKEIEFISGLYKTFDELIVNARDQTVKDNSCNIIKVVINKEDGYLSVWNNGLGIPVKIHKEYKEYVPDFLFGDLRSSGNYDQVGKIVGGKNGYGAKLANIFSKKFIVDNADGKKQFLQTYTNNMQNKTKPKITKTKKSYTKITYYPDFKRFGLKGFNDDIILLFTKRIYDIAACTNKDVKVYLNNNLIKIDTFEDFIKLHYKKIEDKNLIYEEINDRWKIGVVFDKENGFRQISFVNGINTFNGGTHVNHILDQIIKQIAVYVNDKYKLSIKPSQVKDNITIFVDAVIEDPTFESQTKEILTTKYLNFGSTCEVSIAFMKKIYNSGLIDEVVSYAQYKEETLLKKTDGKKVTTLKGLEKLDDAKWAGTRRAKECRLILTEGDSAKSFAVTGLNVIGREQFGVFPLRGKLLNVRKATVKKINQNKEFINIKKILGLRQGKDYSDTKEFHKLRYGGIIILADQDLDGAHIRGLIINMFQHFWPTLLLKDGFIQTMATPIIRATNKKAVLSFYTLTDYNNWMNNNSTKSFKIKYYKGLGTHTRQEAKEVFNEFEKRIVSFIWEKTNIEIQQNKSDTDTETSSQTTEESKDKIISVDQELEILKSKSFESIEMAFGKSRETERKKWLIDYDSNDILNYDKCKVTYSDFIHKDLKHFSNYDNIRSIPSICDGLKPSLRKILYACFIKNQRQKEIKVAQLAGYISEHTGYKHGEASLQEAIVNLAQNFTGSNNINLLNPCGSFGTRAGDEHASARYIYTYVETITEKLFRVEDNCILENIIDEGDIVEYKNFIPILPIILINGSIGIGTGSSTNILMYNPVELAKDLIKIMNGNIIKKLDPWYYGFNGTIEKIKNKYKITGKYEIIDDETVRITEIPIKTSGDDYKKYLESQLSDKNDYRKKLISVWRAKGNNNIDFEIKFKGNELQKLIKSNGLEKFLKISSTLSTNNYNLYNTKGILTKYNSAIDILNEFYEYRLQMYTKRKKYMIKLIGNELLFLKYKVQFIKDKLNKKIIIDKQTFETIIHKLKKLKYPKLSKDLNAKENEKTYDYITRMNMFAVTKEKINELNIEYNKKQKEYDYYVNTSEKDMWKKEINEFLDCYKIWIKKREKEDKNDS